MGKADASAKVRALIGAKLFIGELSLPYFDAMLLDLNDTMQWRDQKEIYDEVRNRENWEKRK